MTWFARFPVSLAALLVSLLALATAGLSNPVLGVADHPELGDHLVTEDGSVLYVFLPDAQGASKCTGGCADAWPPLVAEGDIVAPDTLDAASLDTFEREDGSRQVAYFGWPLYTYAQDTESGTASGQGAGGNWFVIAPDGTVVGADVGAAEPAQASMSQDEYDALYRDGIRAYRSVCASCHGREGDEVLSSHVVKIADNDNLADAEHVINQVIHGNGYMPGFSEALDDRQVAAVVTYIRDSWGNEYGPVREEEIAEYR